MHRTSSRGRVACSRHIVVAFMVVLFSACTTDAEGPAESVEGRSAFLRAATHDAGTDDDPATNVPSKTSLVPSNVPIHLQPFD